jgi:cysteine desulfurase
LDLRGKERWAGNPVVLGLKAKERQAGSLSYLRMRRVYLDHSATTPVDERVVAAMMPFLTGHFGNASSVHLFGQEARAAVDRARRQVASLIGARANEVVFTSGGTEANNLAIRGTCEAGEPYGRHIITSAIEHPSVRGPIEVLEKAGWKLRASPYMRMALCGSKTCVRHCGRKQFSSA